MSRLVSRRGVVTGAAASAAAFSLQVRPAKAKTTHEVSIRRFVYEPSHLTVQVGDRIRWTNFDIAPHTATADAFGWDTLELAQNQSVEIEVREGMETTYFCAFHPHMKGSLEVV